jgi:hypothetical protein
MAGDAMSKRSSASARDERAIAERTIDATRTIAECVLTLERALAHAFDSATGDRSAAAVRARLRQDLEAIFAFLKSVSGETRLLKCVGGWTADQVTADQRNLRAAGMRLWRLALALENPTRDPLFLRGATKHNAQRVWCARAHVSVGMFALVKAGLTRTAAAKKAAEGNFGVFRELAAFTRDDQSSTDKKILSWFDDFRKGDRGKIKNQLALAFFDDGRRLIEGLPQSGDRSKRLYAVADRMFALAVAMIIRD